MDRQPGWRLAAIGLVALTLGACAHPAGDFGRPDRLPWEEGMPTGVKSSSGFNLTDQERDMRDRVWRYVVAPHAYDWFGGLVAGPSYGAPIRPEKIKVEQYYLWLHKQPYQSSRARYARLVEDVDDDLATMPATFASICAVIEVDRQRGVAFAGVGGMDDSVGDSVAARRGENRQIIANFSLALGVRYDSYNYTLDHLLVETPHEEAVAANAELGRLAVYADAAAASDFCGTSPSPRRGAADGVPSRFRVETAASVLD